MITDSLKKFADCNYRLMKLLTHPLTLQTLEKIEEIKPNSVRAIHIALRIEQSVCSQILAGLRKHQLIHRYREGKFMIYRVNKERLARLKVLIIEMYEVKFPATDDY